MKKRIYYFLVLFLMSIGFAMAQTNVTGRVVDETGEPVIGASIQIKKTGQGTVSDINYIFRSIPTHPFRQN